MKILLLRNIFPPPRGNKCKWSIGELYPIVSILNSDLLGRTYQREKLDKSTNLAIVIFLEVQ